MVLRVVYIVDGDGTRWAFLVLAVPEEEGIAFELGPWRDVEAIESLFV